MEFRGIAARETWIEIRLHGPLIDGTGQFSVTKQRLLTPVDLFAVLLHFRTTRAVEISSHGAVQCGYLGIRRRSSVNWWAHRRMQSEGDSSSHLLEGQRKHDHGLRESNLSLAILF